MEKKMRIAQETIKLAFKLIIVIAATCGCFYTAYMSKNNIGAIAFSVLACCNANRILPYVIKDYRMLIGQIKRAN